jgi:hypothetical protein
MGKQYHKLHCEICNWTKVTSSEQLGLYEVKRSTIQGRIPYLDENNKTIVPKFKKQPKKYRCPKCGRGVKATKVANPQEKIDRYHEEKAAEEQRQEWEALEEEARKRYEKAKEDYDREQRELDGY